MHAGFLCTEVLFPWITSVTVRAVFETILFSLFRGCVLIHFRVGCLLQVNIKGYSEVHEKLTLFNEQKKELAYEFTGGGPSFLLFAENHWTVDSVGPNQSILKMVATIRLKKLMGALVGWKLQKTVKRELPISLDELKLFAETGELSEAKKARNAELAKLKN